MVALPNGLPQAPEETDRCPSCKSGLLVVVDEQVRGVGSRVDKRCQHCGHLVVELTALDREKVEAAIRMAKAARLSGVRRKRSRPWRG